MNWLINLGKAILAFIDKIASIGEQAAGGDRYDPNIAPEASKVAPDVPLPPNPSPTPPPPKYNWSTKNAIRHSVRVICDEEGFTLEQKNTMYATIGAESNFNLHAVNYNKNSAGVITSTDRGLCQWNDRYHGSEITADEAFNNPEKAVKLMCSYWRRGQRNLWIAYKNGSYKRYL